MEVDQNGTCTDKEMVDKAFEHLNLGHMWYMKGQEDRKPANSHRTMKVIPGITMPLGS